VLYQLSYDPSRKGSETVEIAPFFVKRNLARIGLFACPPEEASRVAPMRAR
jgi:hypothetical protein